MKVSKKFIGPFGPWADPGPNGFGLKWARPNWAWVKMGLGRVGPIHLGLGWVNPKPNGFGSKWADLVLGWADPNPAHGKP